VVLQLPAYVSWMYLVRNELAVDKGQRMFYTDETGETVPASDDEDGNQVGLAGRVLCLDPCPLVANLTSLYLQGVCGICCAWVECMPGDLLQSKDNNCCIARRKSLAAASAQTSWLLDAAELLASARVNESRIIHMLMSCCCCCRNHGSQRTA
jgi:hypothetical protein